MFFLPESFGKLRAWPIPDPHSLSFAVYMKRCDLHDPSNSLFKFIVPPFFHSSVPVFRGEFKMALLEPHQIQNSSLVFVKCDF